jgi:hypothetical protein
MLKTYLFDLAVGEDGSVTAFPTLDEKIRFIFVLVLFLISLCLQ